MSSSSSQQEFRYAQKNAQLGGLDTGRTLGSGSGSGGDSFGGLRSKFGKEDYMRSPTSNGGGSITTDPSRYSRMVDPNSHAASGAARETLIALNNMGKRPGYRSLGGEGGGAEGSTTSIVNLNNDGRETPTSLRTMGSAGQTWLGATRGGGGGATDENVRFKGRAGRESMGRSGGGGGNKRSSSHGSDSNLSGRAANRSKPGGLEDINDAKEEEQYGGGIGLSMYAANIRSESDLQRMADLKRSASVASSGILDRLQSSPPPAVPELPPSATASNYSRNQQQPLQAPPPRSFSPSQTETTVHEHGGVYSGLGLATKIQFPYGRNNEMLVHSHSGSLNSTSGLSATTSVTPTATRNDGSLPLRPPPARHGGQAEERERERAALRDRERAEKEREAAAEREKREQERQRRYSRPPPEYVPTPNASEVSMPFHSTSQMASTTTATSTQTAVAGGLQRQGTRTGDIPIGLDGGYTGAYDSESQDSHSVAHAYVSTAQHVAVTAGQPAQQANAYQRQQQQQQQQQESLQYRQNPPMGANGSSTSLGLPNSTTTGTSSKRVGTPDRGRSYNPAGSMAVPGERSGSSAAQAQPTPAWVGRSSEESSKTWGLDGVHGADKMRTGLGRPIMDDRTRLAAATAPAPPLGPRRVSRVPPPRQ